MKTIITIISFLAFSLSVSANDAHHGHNSKSPYAGQQQRAIKSLSADDIEELQRGGGWGLARAAELNGVPGPLHLLELKDQIPLSAEQVAEITGVYQQMKARATELGLQLIALEQELEHHFQNRTITDRILRGSLADISQVRQDLRYTHLSAHLVTPTILSEHQIRKYNGLRGYETLDPCENVPEGHNPTMWKKHNGCE